MAASKARKVRKPIVKLTGKRVEIATGLIFAALWQGQAAAEDAGHASAAILQPAVAEGATQTLTLEELKALLTAEQLVQLGFDPVTFAALLTANPREAIAKLNQAFHAKLILVSTGGHAATADSSVDESGGAAHSGGVSWLAVLGGLAGAGGIGGAVAAGGGGGGNAITPLPAVTPPTLTPPVALGDSVVTAEDAAITFDVRANDTAGTGGALAVTAINGTAITVATPVAITGGMISLGSDGRVTFTPSANYNGSADFSYTVTNANGGTSTASVTLNVTPVNDAPVNSGPAQTAAAQGVPILLSGLSIADPDAASAVLTTSLHVGNGVLFAAAVGGGAAVDGNGTTTLTLTGTLAQIDATLNAITYRAADGFAGSDALSMTTSDGQSSDTDNFAITVSAVQTGVLSDGYIAGGTVFIDVNGDGQLNDGEPFALTDAHGHFALLTNAQGPLVAFGGTNIDTGLPNLFTMRAVAGSTVVNPLTTVVASLVATGLSLGDANAAVAAAFNLPLGVDFAHFDILADTDPALALAAQKAASDVAMLLTLARGAADPGTADAVEAALLTKLSTLVGTNHFDLGFGALAQLFAGLPGVSDVKVDGLALSGASLAASIGAATSLAGLSTTVAAAMAPGANLAPIAGTDHFHTGIGRAVSIDVLANDRDPNGDALAVTAINGHAITVSGPVAVTGGVVHLDANGALTFVPEPAFTGTPQFSYTVSDGHGGFGTATVDIAVTADGPVLALAPGDLDAAVAHAGDLSAAGVHTIDLVGDVGSIGDAHAAALVAAGLDFADADHITVEAGGTHLATSLKGLQDLHVDAVAVGGITMLTVDSGAHGLTGLFAGNLPSFVATQSDAAVDVTLTVGAGQIEPTLDLSTLAPALAVSGIDHIGVLGDGHLAVSLAQATAVSASGLDFALGADISLAAAPGALTGIAGHAQGLAAVHVDHIDVIGDAATIGDSDASALVSAGLDFADADTITLEAHGTHLGTSLRGLQDLHVDRVTAAPGVTALSIGAGAAGLGGVHAGGLPTFTPGLDVTLTQAGNISPSVDLHALAPDLAAAGIDHIGAANDGSLSVSFGQANDIAAAGLDFAGASDVSVRLDVGEASHAIANAASLAAIHVDHLDLGGGALTLSDGEAGQLVAAGLDFADADHISVEAHGTHLSTTLAGLQSLHVDTVQVEAGVHTLTVVAGDLSALAADNLPQLDIAQADTALSVTLAIATTDIAELTRLAAALRDAGVDHIGLSEPIDGLDAAARDIMASVTKLTGIDFVETAPALGIASYSALLSDLQHAGSAPASIELSDSAAAAVVESGMFASYVAENVAVDATAAGDKPLTTLKAIADLGVDAVTLADQHDKPVYIDLGLASDAPALGEIQSLFAALDPGNGDYQRLFTGSDHVALVVNAATADMLASVDGALGHLAQLGFTEIDVLGGTGSGAIFAGHDPIQVKLIGQDDDLYDYLHHGKS